jgi:hypothetical protein
MRVSMRTALICASAVVTGVTFAARERDARAQGLQPPPPMGQPSPGLQPPPTLSPQQQQPWQPSSSSYGTQQQLERSEKEDSGRGFEIAWLNAEAGGSYLSFGKDLGYDKSTSGGAMVGVGAGLRLLTWTVGARFRLHPQSDYTTWQLTGEAGFHLPLGSWDPYVNLHLGYVHAGVNNVPFDVPAPHGFDLGLSVGSDYYLSALFSIGLDATADVLFLKRSALAAPAGPSTLALTSLYQDASSTGIALVGSLHAGLHFDL